jgi:hypothetical protein
MNETLLQLILDAIQVVNELPEVTPAMHSAMDVPQPSVSAAPTTDDLAAVDAKLGEIEVELQQANSQVAACVDARTNLAYVYPAESGFTGHEVQGDNPLPYTDLVTRYNVATRTSGYRYDEWAGYVDLLRQQHSYWVSARAVMEHDIKWQEWAAGQGLTDIPREIRAMPALQVAA